MLIPVFGPAIIYTLIGCTVVVLLTAIYIVYILTQL